MSFAPITYKGKLLSLHKAIVAPDFASKTVLVGDTWEYDEMWLKRKKHRDALFYWEQARSFFDASTQLPKTSSPLTAYYCFLNAVKVLLKVKGLVVPDRHGVSGKTKGSKTSLSNEIVEFQASGILPELCRYFGETMSGEYPLSDLLYNLPYIHRAYKLTYASRPELFIPIRDPQFVRKTGSSEAWFAAEIDDRRYANEHTVNKLGNAFERDAGAKNAFVIRRKARFAWSYGKSRGASNLKELTAYHRKLRGRAYYIHGPTRLWYLKRQGQGPSVIDRSSLTMTFAAMHRLSELARYTPRLLARHFDAQHNWLLSEFISTALHQFVDELSSEITGQEFMIPGRKSVT